MAVPGCPDQLLEIAAGCFRHQKKKNGGWIINSTFSYQCQSKPWFELWICNINLINHYMLLHFLHYSELFVCMSSLRTWPSHQKSLISSSKVINLRSTTWTLKMMIQKLCVVVSGAPHFQFPWCRVSFGTPAPIPAASLLTVANSRLVKECQWALRWGEESRWEVMMGQLGTLGLPGPLIGSKVISTNPKILK